MSYCGCAQPASYYPVSPYSSGFPLIVVLFILLIIVGCGCALR